MTLDLSKLEIYTHRVLFNSVEFLVFFIIVFSAYWLVPWRHFKTGILLVASYYFYMSWNAKLAGVVATTSLIDYLIARGIEGSEDQRRRKTLLTASIVMNLGLLIYFKYTNFFLESFQSLLASIGVHQQMPVLNVILPIGISFYTFEAISYTVDVYLKRTQAEKNPFHFLLFITFFPRMVAGPIIRARNFLPQLRREKRFSMARFDLGLQYVLMGLFKKIAIADRMATLVDPVYRSPELYSTSGTWVAVIAYSLQIYCDFSGYSDIAIGTAHMLGFKLPENFNMPYLSRNIAEFWRRWHISLSTWLRDYLYIPIGGSAGTFSQTAGTLFMTMTLCGLWHGAKWTFVAFGTAQGVMLIIHRSFRQYCKNRPALRGALETGFGQVMRVALTYICFTFSLVFFRSGDFGMAGEIFRHLFVSHRGVMVRTPVGPWGLALAFAVVTVAHLVMERGIFKRIVPRISPPVWGFAYASLLAVMCLVRVEGQKAFIYFQF